MPAVSLVVAPGMIKDAAKMLLKTDARLLDCAAGIRIQGLKKGFDFLLHSAGS
jgi:hypothetical protein